MEIKLYTLRKKDLELFDSVLPDYVYELSDRKNYFTLGATGEDQGKENLLGMAQFRTAVTEDGSLYAEIVYVYVFDEFRRKSVGSVLTDRIIRLTTEAGVGTLTALFPSENDGELTTEIPVEEIGAFFDNLGFSKVRVEPERFDTMLTEIYPELEVSEVVRYTRFLDY